MKERKIVNFRSVITPNMYVPSMWPMRTIRKGKKNLTITTIYGFGSMGYAYKMHPLKL